MKLLHVIASLNPSTGGPAEAVSRLTSSMEQLGHPTEVLTLDRPTDGWLKTLPFTVHAVGPCTQKYSYTPQLNSWLELNARHYDVAILHGLWNYSSFGSWRLLRSRIPYVIFAHGMLDPWFKGAQPFKHLAKQLYWLGVEGRVLRDAAFVLFTNEEESRLASGTFVGHPSYNRRVVAFGTRDVEGNPADQVSAFQRRFPQLRHRQFLLFLSRLHLKKGCNLLVEAFASIARRIPNLDLVIAGPDENNLRRELEIQAARHQVSERIHWPGMLLGDEKWGAFRSCEAFVLPSHQENFGIVVAEAMACGVPVVITNKVNIWREVEASGGGLVANDDSQSITKALEIFTSLGENDRQLMRERARAGFLKYFDIGTAAHDLVQACKDAKENYATSRRKID